LHLGNLDLENVEEGWERTKEMTEVGLLLCGEKNLVASQEEFEEV